MNKKCGKILLSGFSNAGKSSLINFFLKKKVSIVSHKVQTTNQKIRAILNFKSNQLIFVDTPGIITNKRFFDKKMSRSLLEEFDSCDLNLFILDSSKVINESLLGQINDLVSNFKINFLVLNKIDLIQNEKVVSLISDINKKVNFCETFPISVKKKIGIDILLQKIIKNIPKKPWVFGESDLIDNDLKFQLSEITRERIFKFINKEVPYSVKVKTSFEILKNLVKVSQIILVKKKSQKAILIGRAGQKIKHIGTDTRPEMEKLFKKKVFLDLKVSLQLKKT
ncbi:MAG: GTPase Era [Pelagibacteraceae bacterium TMED124]|nr:GTPase Era [Rickettsiales bacterium]RPG19347.1 MAG: GTPase Era [Pelagibacteraceae bacterium TMED124]